MPPFDAEAARKNARRIESEIDSLAAGYWDMFRFQYKPFWEQSRKISELFKTLKPLAREDRERLWERYSSICEQTRDKQNSERKDREFKSTQHRGDIIREAERARPHSLFGFMPPDMEEMKALGEVLRNARKMLSNHKEEMFGEHKQECFDRIQEIQKVHDCWWEELKRHKSRKREEFEARVRSNLDKNRERHERATDTLRRLRYNADDLRDKISTAWNEGFRSQASEWLSETESKIEDTEQYIQKLEEWIEEDEEKLR